MSKQLLIEEGIVRFTHPGVRPLPSDQLRSHRGQVLSRSNKEKAYPYVEDVIERRTDGRPKQIEPLDAFADELSKLGYAQFRL
jgi:hypothetical protein